MASSIGIAATLSLNTGQFTREMENAKRSYQRTVREMERSTGETFRTTMRSMGGTAADFRSARMSEARDRYQTTAPADDWKTIRTMSAGEAEAAMRSSRSTGPDFLGGVVKGAAAAKALEFSIKAATLGAKFMTGEFKTWGSVLEEASKLPIIGGLIGAGKGAYDFATGADLKADMEAEKQKAARLRKMRLDANANSREMFSKMAEAARFDSETMAFSETDKAIANIERDRKEQVANIQKELASLQGFGQTDLKTRQAAEQAIRDVNTRANLSATMERQKASFAKAEEDRRAAEEAAKMTARAAKEQRVAGLESQLEAVRGKMATAGDRSISPLMSVDSRGFGGMVTTSSERRRDRRDAEMERLQAEQNRILQEIRDTLKEGQGEHVGL